MNNKSIGILADANTGEWSESCLNLKKHFSGAKIIIPGHGTPGSMELIDQTIALVNEFVRKE